MQWLNILKNIDRKNKNKKFFFLISCLWGSKAFLCARENQAFSEDVYCKSYLRGTCNREYEKKNYKVVLVKSNSKYKISIKNYIHINV